VRDGLQHRRCQLRLGVKRNLRGHLAFGPPGGIRFGPPRLRQEQTLVHQGIAMPRRIASKHAYLTILHLAQGATVLPCDPYRVLPFFDKARLVEHQHAIGSPHLRCDDLNNG
jgi:hypothetical protein